MARQQRQQFFVPALVLLLDKNLHCLGNVLQFFGGGEAVGTDIPGAMCNLLQKAGNADFHELIEVVCRNGQKLYAFKEGIRRVARFFQNALVEGHPLEMAVEVKTRFVKRDSGHEISWGGQTPYLSRVTVR